MREETTSDRLRDEADCRTQFRLLESISAPSENVANVRIDLIIDSPEDWRCQSHVGREWTLRFHFKAEHRFSAVALVDTPLAPHTIAAHTTLDVVNAATIFAPASGDKTEVLAGCGVGRSPVAGAGAVVELRVRQGAERHSLVRLSGLL